MPKNDTKINRDHGYDILINTFEPFLRKFIVNEIFIVNYGNEWKKHIPEGVFNELSRIKEYDVTKIPSIDDFFEELSLLNLKDIIIFSTHFKQSKSLFGELSKDKFIEVMDNLNVYRRKIAHAKSNFSDFDLSKLIEYVQILCQSESGVEIINYIKNEQYKNAKEIPPDFFEEYECQNNLPPESYDLDGGFVGREKEIKALIKMIKSDQDRIVTIIGAGGVGKTAVALKLAYSFLSDSRNPFDAIIWFSAKTSKLTDDGIIALTPEIKTDQQLINDILKIIDPKTLQNFIDAKVPTESYRNYLYKIFSSQKCLIIIDNLETIFKNDALITFIKDIPRPSQVLITSRKGLGEIERRYTLVDMLEKDAIQLFRIISKERNALDLLKYNDGIIGELVKKVRCYPLLIKWSIGQVCLGKDINHAFSEIFSGESEIARFSFNDVFSLLSDNSKLLLYGMIIYGEKPVSRYVLMHLSNLDDEQFEDAVKELIITSFIYPENKETEGRIVSEFSMLNLTRGFVESKLDDDQKIKTMLQTRFFHLSEEIQELEKSKSSYDQSLFSLGIKTTEEQVSFNYVKAAKNFYLKNDIEKAEKNYEQALRVAPNFSYAISEYSKFQFAKGHIHKALEFAKKAVKVNPENYHAWFNCGISLSRSNNFMDAIEYLKKAKQLNPKHLPIFTELGRAYTRIGDYESAELEFTMALKEEKYPNYRHKIITLQFLADNYRRWSEAFGARRDYEGQIKMLKKAFDIIQNATEIGKNDTRLWIAYRIICKDLGIALCKKCGFKEGKIYLEKSMQTIQLGKIFYYPNDELFSEVCFYLAALGMNESDFNTDDINSFINQGLAYCNKSSKFYNKLNDLKKQLNPKYSSEKIAHDRKYGKIKYYNKVRNFGIIDAENDKYIFFPINLHKKIPSEVLENLAGTLVSFVPSENPEKNKLQVASEIILEHE